MKSSKEVVLTGLPPTSRYPHNDATSKECLVVVVREVVVEVVRVVVVVREVVVAVVRLVVREVVIEDI